MPDLCAGGVAEADVMLGVQGFEVDPLRLPLVLRRAVSDDLGDDHARIVIVLIAILYCVTALIALALSARYVRDLSRGAALVLIVLPLCFTGRALLTGRVYAPIEMAYIVHPLRDHRGAFGAPAVHDPNLFDIAFQMIPWREAVRESFAHGEWPLLNRYAANGDLLAAAMQSAPYSPFTWIACIAPAVASFTYTGSIAFFIAALGMFLFARELGASERASIVAAIAFTFAAPTAFQVLWPLGFAWILLPLVLTAVRRVVREPSMRAMLFLIVALVLEITAGHPETLLHVVAIGGAYGVFELAYERNLRGLGLAIAAGAIAALLCAIALLPFLDASPQTVDHQIRAIYAASPLRVPAGEARAALLGDLFPFTRTKLMARAEAGSIVLGLALFGLRVGRKRRETWFFAALAAIGVLAGANAWPVAHLLHRLPLFGLAMNDRLSAAVPMCLAILAAFAVDRLTRGAAFAMLGVFAVVAAGAYAFNGALLDPDRMVAEIVPLALAAIVVIVAQRPTLALILLILAQRVMSDGHLIPINDSRIAFPRTPIFAPMLAARGGEPFRIIGTNGALAPNSATMYGLEDARGTTPMMLAYLDEAAPVWSRSRGAALGNLYDLTRPMLSMMNVRFGIAYAGEVAPQSGWRELMIDAHTRLTENERVLPRAFVPRHVVFADDLEAMKRETDFGDRSWINTDGPAGDRDNGPGRVRTTPLELGYDLDAAMERPGFVVVSEAAWRGWRASIDGRPAKVERANHAFLAVRVPAGRHRLRLVFLPRSFVTGRAVSVVTALLLLIGCRLSSWRWRRR
jgi:membrane protein YfhO